jgi:PPOX class probable F420-dependent enzyme
MTENALLQFKKKNYINIETYRKSGEAVETPVWFVEENGSLFVRTGAQSGKVKRIRRNAQVKVVPCSMAGSPRGTWLSAQAEILIDEAQIGRTEELLKKKYGFQKALLDFFERRNKAETATLRIQLAA